MIHIIKQYKQLFKFMLTANEDMMAAVAEYKNKQEKQKEMAQNDSNILKDGMNEGPIDSKALELSQSLESWLPKVVDLRHVSVDDFDYVKGKLKEWDTVFIDDSMRLSGLGNELKNKWLKVIYKEEDISNISSNSNTSGSNNWKVLINWIEY